MSDDFAARVARGMVVDKQRIKATEMDAMLRFMSTKQTEVNSMNKSTSIVNLAKAMVQVQGEIKGALKDANNPFFKSRYADLESVWEACRAPLVKAGLAVIQTTEGTPEGDFLVTTLVHSSGEWMDGRYRLSPVKNDPQATGSALTYARRYTLAALVGVTQTDTDAEDAMERPQQAAPARPAPNPVSMPKVHPRPSYDESSPVGALVGGVMNTLSEGARLDQEAASIANPHCEGCQEPMVRTKAGAKNPGWWCPLFKNRPDVQHSFFRD